MRHLGSLIAGIVAVPLGWLLLAFGQTSSATAFARLGSTGTYRTHDFIRPLIFLAIAGIVVGLIASLRISPVGPLVAGVAYAGSYVTLLVAPQRVYDLLNYKITIFGQHADLLAPLTTGASLAIGAALLVAIVSVGRWRRWPRPVPAAGQEGTGDEPAGQPGDLPDETITSPAWSAFEPAGGPRDTEPATTAVGTPASGDPPTRTLATDLPVRTPGTWPPSGVTVSPGETTGRLPESSGDAVAPTRGRSPWDTPLGDPSTRQ